MSGIISAISGAPQEASAVGGYYQPALNTEWNPNGSPAAQQYIGQTEAGLQPGFTQEDNTLAAKEAAMVITNSGAAKADFSDLGGQQSAALAQATAPFYSQALGDYASTAGAQAGAEGGAYQGAISNFYGLLGDAASAAAGGIPIGGGGGGAAPGPVTGAITPDSGIPADWDANGFSATTPASSYGSAAYGSTPGASPYGD